MPTISIHGLPKDVVLAELYNAAKPQGLGLLDFDPAPMTLEEAQRLLDANSCGYFDYVKGRVLKIDLATNDVETWLYNRDNGTHAAETVIAALRASGGRDDAAL